MGSVEVKNSLPGRLEMAVGNNAALQIGQEQPVRHRFGQGPGQICHWLDAVRKQLKRRNSAGLRR